MTEETLGEISSIPVSTSPREKFDEFLRTQGMRLTQERGTIVDEVFADHEHFDADQLIERLSSRKDGRRVSRATVYRTLDKLVEAGLLRKVARANDREVYEHDYGYPEHDHLICQKCGEMIEFRNEAIRKILEEVAEHYGFLLESHRLEAFGLCSTCRKPKKRHHKLDMI